MRWRGLLLPGVAWLWAFICHALAILLFADALPIADQWDSEGYLLFKPWLEGQFHASQLLANHNEHRILFKRLLDLAVFALNDGHWDNRVLALANSAVYAAAIALLCQIVVRTTAGWTRRCVLGFVLLLPLATVSLDNTLWAFQSPFFFSSLFAYAAIYAAARSDTTPARLTLALLLCLAAVVTLGSGFLLPIVLAALLATRTLLLRERIPYALPFATAALLVGVAGYLSMPVLPYHDAFKAQNLAELLATLNRVLSWPLSSVPLLWLPLLLWLVSTWRKRRPLATSDLFFLGLAAWVGLQAAAIAYGRGHSTPVVPSRYTEFLLAGVVANLYFCCQLFDHVARDGNRPRPAAWIAGAAQVLALLMLLQQCVLAAYPLGHRLRNWQAGRLLVDGMLAQIPVASDHFALPYPNRDKLAMFVADPTMQKLLRVQDGQLPDACDATRTGPLSRIVCALEAQIGKPPLPTFQPAKPVPAGGADSRCNMDLVDSGAAPGVLSNVMPLRLFGWVGPAGNRFPWPRSGGRMILEGVAGRFEIPLGMRVARPDVAAFVGAPDYYWAGFDIAASAKGLPAGDYAVILQMPGGAPCRADARLHVP